MQPPELVAWPYSNESMIVFEKELLIQIAVMPINRSRSQEAHIIPSFFPDIISNHTKDKQNG